MLTKEERFLLASAMKHLANASYDVVFDLGAGDEIRDAKVALDRLIALLDKS